MTTPLKHLTIELADGTVAVRLEDAEAAVRDAAHKAAQIGFTYGALGRDFTFAYKNVEDMLAAPEGPQDGPLEDQPAQPGGTTAIIDGQYVDARKLPPDHPWHKETP
jgi:hypothetical protein